jgi:hypothetical protein
MSFEVELVGGPFDGQKVNVTIARAARDRLICREAPHSGPTFWRGAVYEMDASSPRRFAFCGYESETA